MIKFLLKIFELFVLLSEGSVLISDPSLYFCFERKDHII